MRNKTEPTEANREYATASIDLGSVRGSADIPLTEEHFKLATGLTLEHLDPSGFKYERSR